MPCNFPLQKYVPLVDPSDPKAGGVCRWPAFCPTNGTERSSDHVFTVEFPAGTLVRVQPGDLTDPEGENGFRALAGTCGPPTDRFALYSSRIGPDLGTTPPAIHFRIMAGVGCITTKVFEGIFTPPTIQDACDFVVQVIGPLATNWEIWTLADETVQPTPFSWELIAAIDRSRVPCAVPWAICLGPHTTQVFPALPPP